MNPPRMTRTERIVGWFFIGTVIIILTGAIVRGIWVLM